MTRFLSVVLIISVIVFGLCKGDDDAKKKIQDDIKKVETDIENVKIDNKKLMTKIHDKDVACSSKLKVEDDKLNKGTEENKRLVKIIEDLYQKIQKSYIEEDELVMAPQNTEKLQLGIKAMKERIKVMKTRRQNGMTKSCLVLEGMANGNASRGPDARTLSGTRISDTIVEENELRLKQSELALQRAGNSELKIQLKNHNAECNRKIRNLNNLVGKVGTNVKKAQASIDDLKKALAEQQKKVTDLNGKSKDKKEELEKWKKEAKKVLDEYTQYAMEINCYEKLYGDVTNLVKT